MFSKKILLSLGVGAAVIGGVVYFVAGGEDSELVNTSQTSDTDTAGQIVVEAGDGTLQADEYSNSYITESARGLEAYLAVGGDSAIYEVVAPAAGTYRLEISLSDDGLWDDGSRNATVVVNDAGMVFYQHRSEDTKGWKWYDIGLVTLKEGTNKIAFTKDETSLAAFVMDEFRLTPDTLVEQ